MRRLLTTLVVAAVVLTAWPSFAAEPGEAITRQAALRRGAAQGPGIEIARAPLAAHQDARDAGRALLTFPPTATLGVGPRLGSPQIIDVQIGVSVQVPLRDVRSARRDAGSAAVAHTKKDTHRARHDAALRAALAWTRSLEALEVVRLRQAMLEQAESIAKLAAKRAQAGVAPPSEPAVALGDAGIARAVFLEAEGVFVEAQHELRHALGSAPDAPLAPVGDLYREPPLAPQDLRQATVSPKNPTLEAAAARTLAARQETRVVSATLGPSLGLGASYLREGTGTTIILGTVSVPLPFVDHAAFERARSQGVEEVIAAQERRLRAELATQLSLTLHDIEHYREIREALEKSALPPLKEALRLALAQLAAGTQDITPVLLSKQRLLSAQEMLAHAAGEALRADLKLAYLTGSLLPEAP